MEDCEQKIVYNIFIDKEKELEVNKLLSCISEEDFPALVTYKKRKSSFGELNIPQKIMEQYSSNIMQSINFYKNIITFYYMLYIVNNEIPNLNIPIDSMIEYLNYIVDNNNFIEKSKNLVINKIKNTKSKSEKIKLGAIHKDILKRKMNVDYDKVVLFYTFYLRKNDWSKLNNLNIKFTIEENVNSSYINNSLEILQKFLDIDVDNKNEQKIIYKKSLSNLS